MALHPDTAARLDEPWPALPLAEWKPTCDTLHMWTQIAGKIRLALAPSLNHWWQVPLYLTARGLTTSPVPFGDRTFEIVFDLLEHNLFVYASDGRRKAMPLMARPVSEFYREIMELLRALDIEVRIWTQPVEVEDGIPFESDTRHASYDPAAVTRFFRVLTQADRVLKEFAGRFTGKQSPVHFFWGSFDLAQTRFSGRRAPPRPQADAITREAYSHEVMSFGFWPGTWGVCDAAFYAYAAPEPDGFKTPELSVPGARYETRLNEFIIELDSLRASGNPRQALLDFYQQVYEGGATLGGWDRAVLDRRPILAPPGPPAREHEPIHP